VKITVRVLGFITIFCTGLQSVQAAPSDIFNSLVEQTESSRRTPVVDVVDPACGEEGKKEFVSLVAQSWYLWYEELAPVSPDDYPTAQAYLNALTAPLAPDGRDPGFSYLTTQAADNAQGSTGAYVGYGFSYAFDAQNRFMFSDVLQGGPAGDADFRRGDEVLAIDVGNGFETIAQLSQRQATSAEVFGASEAGVERSFRVRQGQTVVEVTLIKRELVTPPLATEPLLIARSGNSPVGYLNLRSFISTANTALADATRTFREAGVTDLVIDLRYNGGGLVSVADTMLDLLGGLTAAGQDSWQITHNDKHSDENFGAVFAALPDSMEPMRIAFITTGGTASASELVINSLAPHIEVVLIGKDTLGKAVGQYAFDQSQVSQWASCDTRLRLIAFQIVNGEGNGGYYNGLVSSGGFTLCPAVDDLTRNFGDPEESSLNAALGWLNNGFCSANTASANRAPRLRRIDDSQFDKTARWHLADLPDAPFGLSPWVQ
jgi:C-terminal processing protease CtpA/Prc